MRSKSDRPSSDVVFGLNPVRELLRARPEEVNGLWLASTAQEKSKSAPLSELATLAKDAGVRVQPASRERLAALAGGDAHQGVVAEVRPYAYVELEELIERASETSGRPPLLVVLDGIQDPQNLGAIVRSTYALGGHGVVIPKDRAVGVTGAAMKASAGALAHCPVARVVNLSRALEELKTAGFWIAAADVSGNKAPARAKLEGPLALVVGAEGSGIREGVLKHCDFRLKIPMIGQLGSLNASVSAAILLYEVLRQRA